MSDHASKQLTKKRCNNIRAKKKVIRGEIGTITFAMLEMRQSFRHYSRRDIDRCKV